MGGRGSSGAGGKGGKLDAARTLGTGGSMTAKQAAAHNKLIMSNPLGLKPVDRSAGLGTTKTRRTKTPPSTHTPGHWLNNS